MLLTGRSTPSAPFRSPETLFPTRILTLRFLPNFLKSDLHHLIHDLLRRFKKYHSAPACEESLARIVATPKLGFCKNGHHETRTRSPSALSASVRRPLKMAQGARWGDLWEDCQEALSHLREHNNQNIPPPAPWARLKRLFHSGSLSGASKALIQTEPPFPHTAEALQILRELNPHPATTTVDIPFPERPPPRSFDEAEVCFALKAVARYSAPGTDGLRPSVLKLLAHAPAGHEPEFNFINQFTNFIRTAVTGNLPPSFAVWFGGATLIAIPKSSGSAKLRPIEIGVLLRRFIAGLMAASLRADPTFQSHLLPLQFSAGCANGCE